MKTYLGAVAVLVVVAGLGCQPGKRGSGTGGHGAARGDLYPGTDVVEVADFKLISAKDLDTTGGQLRQGELVYQGRSDLLTVYRDYVADMTEVGWASIYGNVGADKAVGRLRKDCRVAYLEFVSLNDFVTVTIRVAPAEGKP